MDALDQVAMRIPEVNSVSSLSGYSMMTDGVGSSYGMSTISLKPWNERDRVDTEIIEELIEKTRSIKGAAIQFFPPPAVPGFGNANGFELRVLDKTGSGDLDKLARITDDWVAALRERKEIKEIFSSFDPTFPQYMIEIDQQAAAKRHVNVDMAMSNLQTLIGSFYATNFIRYGLMYKVMVQAKPEYRAQPEDIFKLRVKNDRGEMVPYSAFLKIEKVYGPEQITRYNMYNAAMVNGEPAQGYSSGDAIKIIQETAKQYLPRGYDYEWSGMTREEIASGNQVVVIFAICLLFVYLLLSAQYESFLLPMPVLLFLPIGVFGSFLFLKLLGLENNIYAQVAMVMLIGLLGKNAILIVEFANLKQKEGVSVLKASIDGAAARLRPILMTSLSFVAGLIPLMLASGAGAIGNNTIGSAAAGGMIFGTVFGVLVIPGLYVWFASMKKKVEPNEIP